jgi:predicted phage terminase large subunit-like protein
VIILQRSRMDDLAGHVLEQGGWECLSLPTEYEEDQRKTGIGWRDPRREAGELVWPESFGVAAVSEAKRTLGSFAFSAQHQQRPVPASGGIWKKNWFRFYRRVDGPVKFDMTVSSWDCTFKDFRASDYVAGQLWGRLGADFYLLDQIHAKLDFPRTLAAIRCLNQRAGRVVNATLVEDKANGPAVIDMLRREISGLKPVTPEGGKESRAAAVAPLIEAGNVYLPLAEEDPWIEETLLEFSLFPAAKNDDRLDAASQALLYLQKRRPAFDPAVGGLFGKVNQELGPRNLDSSFWANSDSAPNVSGGDSDLWDGLTISSQGGWDTLPGRRRRMY